MKIKKGEIAIVKTTGQRVLVNDIVDSVANVHYYEEDRKSMKAKEYQLDELKTEPDYIQSVREWFRS